MMTFENKLKFKSEFKIILILIFSILFYYIPLYLTSIDILNWKISSTLSLFIFNVYNFIALLPVEIFLEKLSFLKSKKINIVVYFIGGMVYKFI